MNVDVMLEMRRKRRMIKRTAWKNKHSNEHKGVK